MCYNNKKIGDYTMDYVEIIGTIASLFILGSLTFKCVTIKSNIIMRSLNAVGAAIFVAYGALIVKNGGSGWSLIVCDSLLFGFNVFHLIKLIINAKKHKNQQNDETTETQNNE